MQEAGATASLELAFTIADGIEYIRTAQNVSSILHPTIYLSIFSILFSFYLLYSSIFYLSPRLLFYLLATSSNIYY